MTGVQNIRGVVAEQEEIEEIDRGQNRAAKISILYLILRGAPGRF